MEQSNFFKLIGTLVLGLGSAAAIAALQLQNFQTLEPDLTATLTPEQATQTLTQETNDLNLLSRLPDLGFSNLIANWAYLKYLQYFGDIPARRQTGFGLAPDYFDITINRDPHFLRAYLFLYNGVSLYAGQPQGAVDLMATGLSQLTPQTDPQAYYIWRYKATAELLFLGDPQAARQSFQTAADWASHFDDPESQAVAAASQRTADFLAQNPDSREAQIESWFNVFLYSFDPAVQELARERIDTLGGRLEITSDGRATVRIPME
ncbi:hypothetical protein GS597_04220 [Synechococcales cyanobacterium C]|uniref:Uncharacterized protein n=1 Tax=Petrachloros mirabilis ULC683 TaxID=2781853 RepID=A0A8K1ZX47_9CYAN|nr:hypothetical protein [Petrachloros mirabilis]NCJ05728.1 hypothetical protein [Petrachloros mirabilis ULC683]